MRARIIQQHSNLPWLGWVWGVIICSENFLPPTPTPAPAPAHCAFHLWVSKLRFVSREALALSSSSRCLAAFQDTLLEGEVRCPDPSLILGTTSFLGWKNWEVMLVHVGKNLLENCQDYWRATTSSVPLCKCPQPKWILHPYFTSNVICTSWVIGSILHLQGQWQCWGPGQAISYLVILHGKVMVILIFVSVHLCQGFIDTLPHMRA